MQAIKNIPRNEIQICNIITTADLKQKVNITKLNNFPWGIYDQVSYNGICGYVKTPEMKGRVTIFATGKMISIGSNTIQDGRSKKARGSLGARSCETTSSGALSVAVRFGRPTKR